MSIWLSGMFLGLGVGILLMSVKNSWHESRIIKEATRQNKLTAFLNASNDNYMRSIVQVLEKMDQGRINDARILLLGTLDRETQRGKKFLEDIDYKGYNSKGDRGEGKQGHRPRNQG